MQYLISDTHFNHTNVIKYCNRPFVNTEEMNNYLIKQWNSVVKDDDTVYFLGDFCLGNRQTVIELGKQLNGHKILIMGNHDRVTKTAFIDAGFEEVYKKPTVFKFGNSELLLSHAPVYDTDYNNVCGHVHDMNINDKKHFCVCVEQINYTPIELEKVLEYFREQA